MDRVFLLWHSYEDADECEHAFLLGVYSSRAAAETRLESARRLPGFRRYPDGFVVDEYEIDKDHWAEGFATSIAGEWVSDPEPD